MIVISTHAPRVGSDRNQNQAHRHRQISTHAPRVGSDLPAPHVPHTTVHMSTHAPRVGSDQCYLLRNTRNAISTHAPRVGSDCHCVPSFSVVGISTHAPRVGSDSRSSTKQIRYSFQLTLPVWGATLAVGQAFVSGLRFPLTLPVWGATGGGYRLTRHFLYFNSRSPCGERRTGRCCRRPR